MDIDPRNPLDRLRTSSSLPDDHRETCSPEGVALRRPALESFATNRRQFRIRVHEFAHEPVHGDRRRVTNVRDETSNVASGQPIAQTVPPDQRVLVHDAVHPALTKRAQRRGASAPTDAIAVKPQVIFVRCGAERAREASSIIESSRTRARVAPFSPSRRPVPVPVSATSVRADVSAIDTRARNASRSTARARTCTRARTVRRLEIISIVIRVRIQLIVPLLEVLSARLRRVRGTVFAVKAHGDLARACAASDGRARGRVRGGGGGAMGT